LLKGVQQRLLAKIAAANTEQSYNFDIAIITAVEREFQAVKALSNEWKELVFPGDSSSFIETIFERDDKRLRVVAACAPQMGMNASAVLSMKLIYNFRPRYIFMPGIAASVKKSDTHGFGDVIVVDECWDGGAGKISEDSNGNSMFLPAANHLRLNVDVGQRILQIKNNSNLLRSIKDGWKPNDVPNTELAIHIGSVSSVAGVIENGAVIDELKGKDRKLLGLEMEAYGLYYSAYNCGNPKPIAVALKAVSDFANLAKNDLYQTYAAYTSTKVMYEFIMEYVES
jgi:nucleoside phosphorylase